MADTRIKVVLDLDSDIKKAKIGIEQLSQAFSKIGGSKGNALTTTLEQVEKELTKLQTVSGNAMSKVGDSSKAENSIIKLDSAIKKLSKELVDMGTLSAEQAQKMFPPTILAKINKVNSAIKTYTSEIKKSESNTIKQATKEFEDQQKKVKDLTDELQKYEKLKSSKNLVSQDDYNQAKSTQTVSKTAATKAQNKVASLQMQRQAAIDEYNNKTGKNTGAYSKGAKDLQVKIKAAQEQARKLADDAKKAEDYFNSLEVKETLTSKIENTKKALEEATQKSQDLQDNLNNVKADSVAKAMDEAKKKLEGLTGVDLSKITNIEQLNQLFEKFNQEGLESFKKGVLEATGGIQQLDSANKGMAMSTEENKRSVESQNRALEDVSGLKSRIQYFFSLTNGVMLARRALQQAFQAVKELDAAMTETAVVTNFDVSDMWAALPQYTETANKLGATTLGAYETMTLFYQQGLDTNEVFEIGTETMKMARIAGLEYSEATDLMTAALRGFNMELNQVSAQRVNDIYSELAAITAADTQEIATAMTKTASIASNANMELETTAALLAQIIETTREPAETAGTAMKTIIARFTEMKEATSDIIEVDGEEISVNKVDAALASVGVSLKNAKGEFRDLDDVFMDLAKKWNSLDVMSQRYIATTAAGSRQQSRFIAMMSNYDRTLELVEAAYNSAGASSAQFAKTQESLEAKINKLQNAWQEFLLGVTNSEVIKFFVDTLTSLLNIVNDLTAGSGSITNSILKMYTAFAGFKVLKNIFNQTIGTIGTTFLNGGKQAGIQFNAGLSSTIGKIKVNFPFFGKLSKELKASLKEIQTFSKNGQISLSNLTNVLKTKSTSTISALAQPLGNSIKQSLNSSISSLGTLTPQGQEWADTLIDGFIQQIATGEVKIETALEKLQAKIKQGLIKATTQTQQDGTQQTTTKIDESLLKVNKGVTAEQVDSNTNMGSLIIDPKELQQSAVQINQYTQSIMMLGMVANMAGGKLEEMGGTAGKIGKGLSAVGNAATMASMAVMALKAAFQSLGGPQLAIIGAVIAALSLAFSAYQNYKENIQKAREETIKSAEDKQEEVEKNRELSSSLDEVIQKYQEGNATREEVAEAADELITKYDLESERINLLTGNYERLTEAIKEKQKQEEQENYASQKNAESAYRRNLFDAGIEKTQKLRPGASTKDEIVIDEEFEDRFINAIEQTGMSGLIKLGENGILEFTENINNFTDEQLANLSKFLNLYLSMLATQLEEQGLKPEESEIYMSLATIAGETEEAFEGLISSINNASDSLQRAVGAEFEKNNNPEQIYSRKEYNKAREKYINELKKQSPGISDQSAKDIADSYFQSYANTSGYVNADNAIIELQTKVSGDPEDIEIVKQYLNGEISPEYLISILGKVDIEQGASIDNINQDIADVQVKAAYNAYEDFYKATQKITDYINQNYTIKGIEEETLQDFEAQLRIINDTMPEGVDLLEDWNEALKGGTVGISTFFMNLQAYLGQRSLMMQQTGLNNTIYGVSATNEQMKKDISGYSKKTDEEKKAIQEKYNVDDKTIKNAEKLFNMPIEEQYKELQNQLTIAENEKAKLEKQKTDINKSQEEKFAQLNPVLDEKIKGQEKAINDLYTNKENEIQFFEAEKEKIIKDNPLDKENQLFILNNAIETTRSNYDQEIQQAENNLASLEAEKAAFLNPQNSQSRISEIENELINLQNNYEAQVSDINEKLENTTNERQKMKLEGQKSEAYIEYTTNKEELEKELAGLQNRLEELQEGNTVKIDADISEAEKEIEEIQNKIDALGNQKAIESQIKINVAINNAQQIATLQQQFQKLKELTKDSTQVDLSTFNQLKEIMPGIGVGATVLADGTIDISKGLAAVNAELQKRLGLEGQITAQTLRQAKAEEEAYIKSLEKLRDQLKAKIQAAKDSGDTEINLKGDVEKTITEMTSNGAYERAKLIEQSNEDMGDSAEEGAKATINAVNQMGAAYQKLGNTIKQIGEQMADPVGAAAATYSNASFNPYVSSAENSTNKEDYNAEDFYKTIDGIAEDQKDSTISIEEAENALAQIEQQINDGKKRVDDLTALESALYGGGAGKDDGGSGGEKESKEKVKKANYAEQNADKQLEALDRVRQTNDREAELIEKLPEEIQFPLKMANLGEDMLYEYQEIQINKNKQAALQNQLDAEEKQAKYLGEYYYYDEFTDAYMYDVEKMASDDLDDEKRQEIEEEISNLQEINDKLNAVEDELDGGKIQKVFRTLEKATDGASKALKKEAKAADLLEEEFGDLAKQLGLDDELKKFGDSIDNTIKSSKLLNKSFEGLGIVSEETLSKLDKLPIGDNTKNLIKNTLGKNEGGTIGSVMGDMFGASSDMFGSIGDILNFDMMTMGLDGMNMMKDMGQKMIQYVVQFVQTIINWWINREDWLYNLLSAIEQEVRNFNRQSEVEERFRLYSDEGLNDLVSAWEAMRASLEKQIDLNEQLIESRQAELQFLNMTNLPFAPAFYYDYAEERVIENPWVYDIYVLLLDIGSMIPEFGQIFSSIKQLMEDNKKRMEDAVQEIEDARDKILELEKQQLELRTKYMEDEIELEELVMDTIIEKQQEQIDELSTMNEAIEQGNEKLIQTLNDNLDRIRQQRENQDKEEELAEKERRLAYLRQDTSNANRAEIMNLQEELKNERRDYTDELIDQKISELEKQNELAAEQRQKQIDLLQSQLDYTEKYGLQWAEAQTLIKNGFDSEGRLRVGTDLYNMLMSKEDFTSMGLGSTRQTQQIMDWNVTSIAAAAFREINDIWEEGFGNFEMSNDVHDQSRLHLWEDRQVDYYQLPSWLSFLQPAANTIQDYLWRTGNNISAFVETGFLSGKNSSSILGKTVVPLLQGIYKAVVGRVDEYNSLNEAETGGFEEVSGAITQASDNLGYGLGEKLVNGISNAFASVGGDIVNGFTNSMSNYAVPKTQTQTTGNFNMNFYINSEDREEGMSIGESVLRAFREGISNLSIFG